ncbi:40S ribosomal protein S21-2-like [Prosopis cineraria]|uniref:40S ribosomal protein S21-2-like n=1 Tax=Prosopis cineraria TaxID=364024 RepID=UPI00240ECB67|nr:40S ribosomal protein S21-2-like [Prosopis cineraria]
MQNEEGQITELYIPRKCSATNRLITAKDHASVQINIGRLDENGIYNGHFSTFALCGFIRAQARLPYLITYLFICFCSAAFYSITIFLCLSLAKSNVFQEMDCILN